MIWPYIKKPILVFSVPNTGTHSAVREIKEAYPDNEVFRSHCSPEAIERIKLGNYFVVATYRDPLQTLRSWAKRGGYNKAKERFEEIWGNYFKGLEYADLIVDVSALKYCENSILGETKAELEPAQVEQANKMKDKLKPLVKDRIQ